jgi:hypothetical protein
VSHGNLRLQAIMKTPARKRKQSASKKHSPEDGSRRGKELWSSSAQGYFNFQYGVTLSTYLTITMQLTYSLRLRHELRRFPGVLLQQLDA